MLTRGCTFCFTDSSLAFCCFCNGSLKLEVARDGRFVVLEDLRIGGFLDDACNDGLVVVLAESVAGSTGLISLGKVDVIVVECILDDTNP